MNDVRCHLFSEDLADLRFRQVVGGAVFETYAR